MNGLPKESSLALGLEFCISMAFWLLGWILQSQRYLLLNEVPDNVFLNIHYQGSTSLQGSLVHPCPSDLESPCHLVPSSKWLNTVLGKGKKFICSGKDSKGSNPRPHEILVSSRISIYSRNLDFLFIDHGGFVVTVTGFGFYRLGDILKAVDD